MLLINITSKLIALIRLIRTNKIEMIYLNNKLS